GDDIDFSAIARGTTGMVGADLENILNEAALRAERHEKEAITMADIEYAKFRVIGGKERKSAVISDAEKLMTAYHEAGHAIVMHYTPGCNPVSMVSIIPRGMA